jgi:c-di-GMP-binding flagellar brake protein YcgR
MIERRRYERVAFFCPMHVTVMPDGIAVPARSFDISIGGVGLTTQIELKRGDTILARFHLRNGGVEEIDEEVMGRVAYCQADENGNRIGVEFCATIQESKQPALAHKINNL